MKEGEFKTKRIKQDILIQNNIENYQKEYKSLQFW